MAYKWKPTKAQRREFAERMATDTAYSEAYHQRKEQRAEKKRSTSSLITKLQGANTYPQEAKIKQRLSC